MPTQIKLEKKEPFVEPLSVRLTQKNAKKIERLLKKTDYKKVELINEIIAGVDIVSTTRKEIRRAR